MCVTTHELFWIVAIEWWIDRFQELKQLVEVHFLVFVHPKLSEELSLDMRALSRTLQLPLERSTLKKFCYKTVFAACSPNKRCSPCSVALSASANVCVKTSRIPSTSVGRVLAFTSLVTFDKNRALTEIS